MDKASAPSQIAAIAKRTTFLVIMVLIGNKIPKLRSKEIATKLNTEAAKEPTWAEWKNLHKAVPINVPNQPFHTYTHLSI